MGGGIACAAWAVVAPASAAETAEPPYGRVEGDASLVVGLGAVAASRGPRAEAELRVRYLETAGVFVTYEDAFGAGAATPQRVLAGGFEIRPLFLLRWLRGMERAQPWSDLVIDSLGLELGATWAEPSAPAIPWQAGALLGLGVEVPLGTRATGPWVGVHGGLRWSEAALATGAVRSADERSVVLALTLAWHELVMTHVVDLGDRAPK